jgi:hypothetical protein
VCLVMCFVSARALPTHTHHSTCLSVDGGLVGLEGGLVLPDVAVPQGGVLEVEFEERVADKPGTLQVSNQVTGDVAGDLDCKVCASTGNEQRAKPVARGVVVQHTHRCNNEDTQRTGGRGGPDAIEIGDLVTLNGVVDETST